MADKNQSLLYTLMIVPVAEALTWAILNAFGGEKGTMAFVGVAIGALSGVYAVGPNKWLADPDVGGNFGRDHPLISRFFCLFGVVCGCALVVQGVSGK